MTTIPTWIGIMLIAIYWFGMASMVVNAYYHFNVRTNYEKVTSS